MKVELHITLKDAILDPQGTAIERSLRRLGYEEVEKVRVGKFVQMTLDETDKEKAKERVEEMCMRLLSNPVIENVKYDFKG